MKKILFLFVSVLVIVSCSTGKGVQGYSWEYHEIDSTYDHGKNLAAVNLIESYSDVMGPMLEIIGYSDHLASKGFPESGLSNFAADVIRETAEQKTGQKMDIGLTNFGGIRTDMPKGDVRVYDIFSIFPFENRIVVATVKGSKLRGMIEKWAEKNRVEALSNVEIVIDNGKLKKCNVAGKPIENNRLYKLATIDFLLEGGDGNRVKSISEKIDYTDILIRDAVVDYIKDKTSRGEVLDLKADGRVKVIKDNNRR